VQVLPKGSWKLKPMKGMKGTPQASWIHFWKRVRKSDGIAKFLQIFDVKLQAPFHHQITRSHLHYRFVKM